MLTLVLDLLDLLPSGFEVAKSTLSGLTTVNDATIGVALAAGVAGMLALETRASSAVGVAISITTIPAAAYLGVAAGVGDARNSLGALAVLSVNVAMLVLAGTLTPSCNAGSRQAGGLLASARSPDRGDERDGGLFPEAAKPPAPAAPALR